jgi:hypothetical protein
VKISGSRQLAGLSIDRFLDDRLGCFVPISGATSRAGSHRNDDSAVDVSLIGPLAERYFLHCSQDHFAFADIANACLVPTRHGPQPVLDKPNSAQT